jgi:phospholipase C
MAVLKALSAFAVMLPLYAAPALAGSIADIEHVVLFMQGLRAPLLTPPSPLTGIRKPSI